MFQAQFSFVLRVRIDHRPRMLGRVATAIGEAGGTTGSIELAAVDAAHTLRDITVGAAGTDHAQEIVEAVGRLDAAEVVDSTDRTFRMHVGGKIEQHSKHPLRACDNLSMAYTPGGARMCEAIAGDPDEAFHYTVKRNTVAVAPEQELREDHILPSPFNRDVPAAVAAAAAAEQATREGTAGADRGALAHAPGDRQEFGAGRP